MNTKYGVMNIIVWGGDDRLWGGVGFSDGSVGPDLGLPSENRNTKPPPCAVEVEQTEVNKREGGEWWWVADGVGVWLMVAVVGVRERKRGMGRTEERDG
ncbi:hypothetical protein HanXRQr2_Chr09g0363051 [Helianthus annuus]|uniref:Uncharacterized protein n=1 Tax=Helianthus annuus TaxID=4232 RepID=A0A9K3N6I8_HELAN|nr:hypothetical protein HanXRQr2_Chr09g0363051 [Helianthus annuus]